MSEKRSRSAPAAVESQVRLEAPRWRRSPWNYLFASLLMLLPCYWQPHIQAGDLSSHIYNAWLAQLIDAGKLPGLVVVNQATNILFDQILSGLFRALGPDLAQRIAVSLAVLTFSWGAFAFVSAASGRKAWSLLPCIAMLAYGWVFHMGFFDFYLGLGLSFWGLALAWDPRPKRIAAAALVFVLAFLAHALACAWGLAFVVFVLTAKRLGPSRLPRLTGAALAALIAVRLALSGVWPTRWSPGQLGLITGADQLRVFDGKYFILFAALLVVWGMMLADSIRHGGSRGLRSGLPLQLCVLSAAGVLVLPGAIDIPIYRHALVYIAERLSLGAAVCICALLASAPVRPLPRWALAGLTLVFFGFLLHDESALNDFEGRMKQLAMRLPPGQRLLSAPDDESLRVNALAHMIDRVCIGHCYSYANYEPSTWQFRVRAIAPNPYVASNYTDSIEMQVGEYVVQPRDLPLYELTLDDSGKLMVVSLQAGGPNGSKECKILPDIL